MARIRKCPLPEELRKRARPYSREQLGGALYGKLCNDPNFDVMSMFLKNFPLLAARKIEIEVPESGQFKPCCLNFDNAMCAWEQVEWICLTVRPGYRDDRHRMLYAETPFPQMDGRMMSVLLASGTKEQILDWLRRENTGPELMAVVDDINDQLTCSF